MSLIRKHLFHLWMSKDKLKIWQKRSREVFWCSGVLPQGPPGWFTAPALSWAHKDHTVHIPGVGGSRAAALKWQVNDTPQMVTCQNWQKHVCLCDRKLKQETRRTLPKKKNIEKEKIWTEIKIHCGLEINICGWVMLPKTGNFLQRALSHLVFCHHSQWICA